MIRHNRSHGHPLHSGLAQYVFTLFCLWIQLCKDESAVCAPLPHYNPIHSASHLNQQHTVTVGTHMQVIQKALWRWASGEAAGEETLKAVVADLHRGGLVLCGRLP